MAVRASPPLELPLLELPLELPLELLPEEPELPDDSPPLPLLLDVGAEDVMGFCRV